MRTKTTETTAARCLPWLTALLLAGVLALFTAQGAAYAAPEDDESGISVSVEISESATPDPDPSPEPEPSPDPDPGDPSEPGPTDPDPTPGPGDKTPPIDEHPDGGMGDLPRTGFSAGTVLWIAFGLVVIGAIVRVRVNVMRDRKSH